MDKISYIINGLKYNKSGISLKFMSFKYFSSIWLPNQV